MSDAGISDNEVDDLATPAEVEEVEAPRDTVEENGLDEDEDDLFGDGGDDAEEPASVARTELEELVANSISGTASLTMKTSILATMKGGQTASGRQKLSRRKASSTHSQLWTRTLRDTPFQNPATASCTY
jgi:hypothetical protein